MPTQASLFPDNEFTPAQPPASRALPVSSTRHWWGTHACGQRIWVEQDEGETRFSLHDRRPFEVCPTCGQELHADDLPPDPPAAPTDFSDFPTIDIMPRRAMVIHADLWSSSLAVIAVTTNSKVVNGSLVMGAGAARQAKERYPDLPAAAGQRILETCGDGGWYGWMVFRRDERRIGLFQTKTMFIPPASLDLIAYSVERLSKWCKRHPTLRVAMNYPGVGLGGLSREQVAPLLVRLPNQVVIYDNKCVSQE
jgi:hypothetical protein